MAEPTQRPRRVAWGTLGPPRDPRARIIEAASHCLTKFGVERTSLTAIANQAGVSRQTIYKYFPTKEEIVIEAVRQEAAEASERIMAVAQKHSTAAGFVVELCVAAHFEFKHNPAIWPFFTELDRVDIRKRLLDSETIDMVKHFLEPILSYLPETAPYLNEMTETFLRFYLSLLTYNSTVTETRSALRGYLHRVLVPALGLPADDDHRGR